MKECCINSELFFGEGGWRGINYAVTNFRFSMTDALV